MSWMATYEVTPEEGLKCIYKPAQIPDEAKDQHDAALLSAVRLLDEYVVGSRKYNFRISLSGHANPNHAPKEGWSNDFINIQVVQL